MQTKEWCNRQGGQRLATGKVLATNREKQGKEKEKNENVEENGKWKEEKWKQMIKEMRKMRNVR